MPKLYYKYGAMGSSKSAQALICKFNYEEKGFGVLLIKPSLDTRDLEMGEIVVKSRIGLSSKCVVFDNQTDLLELYKQIRTKCSVDVIIVDECNLCTPQHIDSLKEISLSIPVICFGLKNNFKTQLFPASKRLLELAESVQEVKSICRCGSKATQNLRRVDGKATASGPEIFIGGNESYEGVCYKCYKEEIEKSNKNAN